MRVFIALRMISFCTARSDSLALKTPLLNDLVTAFKGLYLIFEWEGGKTSLQVTVWGIDTIVRGVNRPRQISWREIPSSSTTFMIFYLLENFDTVIPTAIRKYTIMIAPLTYKHHIEAIIFPP
jgi:hypothetical protein